jgi:hypothetical protein
VSGGTNGFQRLVLLQPEMENKLAPRESRIAAKMVGRSTSTLGGGFTVRDEIEPVFTFYLLDTHFTPTTTGFPTLFSNGVLLYGEYRVRTNWFDLPGHSTVGFLYSNATRTALDTNPYVLIPGIMSESPFRQRAHPGQ